VTESVLIDEGEKISVIPAQAGIQWRFNALNRPQVSRRR
jgi:hypothetical protein